MGTDYRSPGTQFTCFTSTKVQILTPEELRVRRQGTEQITSCLVSILILLYMCPYTAYICVLSLLCMCPQEAGNEQIASYLVYILTAVAPVKQVN